MRANTFDFFVTSLLHVRSPPRKIIVRLHLTVILALTRVLHGLIRSGLWLIRGVNGYRLKFQGDRNQDSIFLNSNLTKN